MFKGYADPVTLRDTGRPSKPTIQRRGNAILVATRLIVENGLANKHFFAPYAYEKLLKLANTHWGAMQLAIKKGVKMAIGTDTSGTVPGSDRYTFSVVGKELELHVKVGLASIYSLLLLVFC